MEKDRRKRDKDNQCGENWEYKRGITKYCGYRTKMGTQDNVILKDMVDKIEGGMDRGREREREWGERRNGEKLRKMEIERKAAEK